MTALVLLALGVHDLAEGLLCATRHDRRRGLLALAAAVLALTLGWAVLAASSGVSPAGGLPGAGLLAVGALGVWVLTARSHPLVPVAAVAALALLAAAEAGLARAELRFAPPGLVLVAVAVALAGTGNRVTRAVLELAGRRAAQEGRAVSGRTDDDGAGSELRGGRWIGPMERLLMAALGLAAAFPVIAAVMAAKGLVRFPEISADTGDGSRAEEFLVGSLTSWSLAAAGAFLAHAALHPWP